ncbi:hypothetical protein Y1Q_0010303 [Alligator mississippiensis]|uniref:Uncharacterized protein n=1 Tax=Alligator mississippiensis TaxID=8496 RepID=A0A151NM40_ALLMI|nr:hypothetical protein Y1Q_0010303 [Alligator mississippiensis]
MLLSTTQTVLVSPGGMNGGVFAMQDEMSAGKYLVTKMECAWHHPQLDVIGKGGCRYDSEGDLEESLQHVKKCLHVHGSWCEANC